MRWSAFPPQQGFGGVIRWRTPVACELGIGKDVGELAALSGSLFAYHAQHLVPATNQYTNTITAACSAAVTTSSNLRALVFGSFSFVATSGTDSKKLRM